ncbi:MAG: hypothetical protein ACTSV1_01400 [Alphaproteobacteria bacterium]
MFMFSSPSHAIGGCVDVPEGAWWGKPDHKKISSYVAKRHDGNWKPYRVKWARQLKTMQDIQLRGGSAVLKKKGLTLNGETLGEYIRALEVRVAANECLSRNADMEQAAKEMNDMSTAAGGNN